VCSSVLPFSLTSRSQLSHAGLFPSLPDFLYLGTESSCALCKTCLKICQLCSAPLSLRTVSQGVLLTNSLKSWKLAFLKFEIVTILLAYTPQALVLMGDFKHPDICCKDHTARHTQCRRFLQSIYDNFLMQVVEEPTRKGALLDLVVKNRDGLVEDVQVGGSLG